MKKEMTIDSSWAGERYKQHKKGSAGGHCLKLDAYTYKCCPKANFW